MRLKCWNPVIFRPANLIPNSVARPDYCGWYRKHLAIILSQRTLGHGNNLRAVMKNRSLMSPKYHGAAMELKISLAFLSGSFVFFTGVTGGWCRGGRCQNRLRTSSETFSKNLISSWRWRIWTFNLLWKWKAIIQNYITILIFFNQFGLNISEQFIRLGPLLKLPVWALRWSCAYSQAPNKALNKARQMCTSFWRARSKINLTTMCRNDTIALCRILMFQPIR